MSNEFRTTTDPERDRALAGTEPKTKTDRATKWLRKASRRRAVVMDRQPQPWNKQQGPTWAAELAMATMLDAQVQSAVDGMRAVAHVHEEEHRIAESTRQQALRVHNAYAKHARRCLRMLRELAAVQPAVPSGTYVMELRDKGVEICRLSIPTPISVQATAPVDVVVQMPDGRHLSQPLHPHETLYLDESCVSVLVSTEGVGARVTIGYGPDSGCDRAAAGAAPAAPGWPDLAI